MPVPDLDLLKRVAQHDENALMALYEQYSNLVYSLSLRVLRQPALAEEVTQDVFLKLWKQPDRWDPSLGHFSSWLLTITRNASIDRLRREGRQSIVDWDKAGEGELAVREVQSYAADQANWIDGQLMRKLLQRLPPEQRQLIELAFYEGYTQSELADLLNLPLGTVKTRIRNGMQKLRTLWEEAQQRPEQV